MAMFVLCLFSLQGFEDCIVFDEIMDQCNEDFSEWIVNAVGTMKANS